MAENENKEKKKSGFMSLIITITLAVMISMGGTYFLMKYMNKSSTPQNVTNKAIRTMAVLIRPGSNATFPLRGGNQILVIDSLTFLVGSKECGQSIGINTPQIMDGIQMLLLSKSPSEILNPDALQTLKQQMIDLIDQITGFTGEKAPLGILQVYLYIKAVAPV